MDLRIVKTKKAIQSTFIELRKTTPLEKIRVRDLCRIALINKSTFYNHYEDAFALSEELENELLNQCMNDFEYKDCLLTDPMRFLENVPVVLEKQEPYLSILFSGRLDVLYKKIQRQLRKSYSSPDMTAEEDVKLTFIIGGTMYAMQELMSEGKYTKKQITASTADIIKTMN